MRRLAGLRRPAGLVLLAVAPLVILSLDFSRRHARLTELNGQELEWYFGAVVESFAVWTALLYAGSRRRGRLRWLNAGLFVLCLTFAVGGQSYFYAQYKAYLNVDVSVFASNFMDSVVNQLWADIGNYARAKLPVLLLALALLWVGRWVLRPRRSAARRVGVLAPLVLMASLFIPTQHRHAQASTPDVLYLNAVGGLIRTQLGMTDQSSQIRPRARESLPVPDLSRAPLPKRNVLFVIGESVRADSVCVEYDPTCQRTAATNLLLPDRHPFTQMRSLASCTAISLAVLWGGLLPTESREILHTWPLIFDYARAAGYDTAFWTSQNMMFGNARLWVKNLGVSHFTSATELDPTADLDMGAPEHLLAARVNRELSELQEPFLAVVQLSNVHYPYYVDPDGPMPFQPWTTSKAEEDNPYFKNFYQNSVYQQDQHVADMIRHLQKSSVGDHTVIVYTSDHGEAFREHGQMGHTFSVFDEEIKVPAWIDAPPGTLTPAEQESLEQKRHEYLYHVDLAPTILDLVGVLDDPHIQRYLARLPGHSLLRPALTERPLPATNCAGVWSCAFENWGFLDGPRKLEARSWDEGWNCYDLERDPKERNDLGAAACGDLIARAQQTFGRLPGQGLERH